MFQRKKRQQTSKNDSSVSITSLPPEMTLHMFSFLRQASDRLNAGLVCRDWHEISKDTSLSTNNQQALIRYQQLSKPLATRVVEAKREKIEAEIKKQPQENQGMLTLACHIQHETNNLVSVRVLVCGTATQKRDGFYRQVGYSEFKPVKLSDNLQLTYQDIPEQTNGYFKSLNPEKDVVLFCPNPSQDLEQQLSAFKKRLNNNNVTIFVLGNTNQLRSISFQEEGDDLLAFSSRLINVILGDYTKLEEVILPKKDDDHDHDDERKDRCILS